ncbi:MAG TPA: hypothetical protein VLA54_12705 [Acidimicrobiia bacterium]|nr:hypothetical protein [Acidimicrobiia bacterium]
MVLVEVPAAVVAVRTGVVVEEVEGTPVEGTPVEGTPAEGGGPGEHEAINNASETPTDQRQRLLILDTS